MLLDFLQARNTKPVKEEKQIMDGLKIILDNGWILQTEEILSFFETIGLRKNLSVNTENLMFLEFVYLMCRLLEIDTTRMQSYFDV